MSAVLDNTAAIAAYRARLARFDNSYQYSDDHGVWKAGQREVAELNALQRELDADRAIWNEVRGIS